jgi:hypothetical protein
MSQERTFLTPDLMPKTPTTDFNAVVNGTRFKRENRKIRGFDLLKNVS